MTILRRGVSGDPRHGRPMMQLRDARADVMDALDEGSTCPCCDQFAKRYKRKLNRTMVRWLIWLTRTWIEDGREWVNIHEGGNTGGGGEYAKVAHWGLAELRPNDDEARKTSGCWRPTVLGIRFVGGVVSVPTHVYLYDNGVDGWSDETTDVSDALGVPFDWPEVRGCAGFLPKMVAPWIPGPPPTGEQLSLL